MRKISIHASILAAVCLTWPCWAADNTIGIKVFTGARIIDGTGKPSMQKASLVIQNGRIQAVGTSVKIPAGAQRIDASGKTIIPGLISAHSHVNESANLDTFARYGVTTVFSLGGDKEIQIRDQVRAEQQTPSLT